MKTRVLAWAKEHKRASAVIVLVLVGLIVLPFAGDDDSDDGRTVHAQGPESDATQDVLEERVEEPMAERSAALDEAESGDAPAQEAEPETQTELSKTDPAWCEDTDNFLSLGQTAANRDDPAGGYWSQEDLDACGGMWGFECEVVNEFGTFRSTVHYAKIFGNRDKRYENADDARRDAEFTPVEGETVTCSLYGEGGA